MEETSPPLPVLIVGAGPTGLVLALWLARRGVKVRVIDKSEGPGRTSRAIAVQARTLEFYRQLGLAEKLIARGLITQEFILRRRGREVARAKPGAIGGDVTPYPYLLFVGQDVHEELLIEELAGLGVRVERRTELVAFRQDDEGVSANVRTAEGAIETWRALYLCGADGAHSSVRRGLGLDFPGGTYSQMFYVADVTARGEAAGGQLNISVSEEGFCIVLPIRTKGTFRLIGIVPPAAEGKKEIAFEDVAASAARSTGLTFDKLVWFSTYHVHHRVADHFRAGRVFLAGDAGHIHSPAGGQGMNTGIGDAVALAWRLAEAVRSEGARDRLDSYEPERLSFARLLVKTTDRAFRLTADRGFFGSLFRLYVMPRLFVTVMGTPVLARLFFRLISQTRIAYPDSPLSEGRAGGVRAGDRLPWIGENYDPLKSLDWQVHVYGEVREELRAGLKLTLHIFPWGEEARAKGLQRDAVYLIRPDGYVAFAESEQDLTALRRYLDQN